MFIAGGFYTHLNAPPGNTGLHIASYYCIRSMCIADKCVYLFVCMAMDMHVGKSVYARPTLPSTR